MNWMRFDDKKPKIGMHILAVDQQKLWWGFYNPARETGDPGFVPVFWVKVPPIPLFPKEEVAPPIPEVVSSEENSEVKLGQEDSEDREAKQKRGKRAKDSGET